MNNFWISNMSALDLSDADEKDQQDICRVCRSEGSSDKPLFHPCICTGSIKFIHQECLVQWLRYSRKEYCELCNHRFSFTPIYSPDMPQRLSIKDVLGGLISSVITVVQSWFHYTLVFLAWLVFVPLIAYRIYKCLFTGSVSSLLTLPLDLLSVDHLVTDILSGCIVVVFTLCGFISLVWLREQMLHGGGPDWLEPEQQPAPVEIDGEADFDNAEARVGAQAVNADAPQNEFVNNNENIAQDENNWNPIEWDRGPEELTWERLLGLDGSLVFIEHVFWVVSLNTFFIVVFAFCPYHCGHLTIAAFQLEDLLNSQFEGILTTFCGYCVIGLLLVLLHTLASSLYLIKLQRFFGLCYVVVKVCLLSVFEIGLFPLICGYWLDVCSLKLFDATLKDRMDSFHHGPGTSIFLHWLAGMVFVFYFALFVLLLREVLRPGVLWFLRNVNDPDFNPIQEMIQQPFLNHIKRFLVSKVVFGTVILLMFWIPVSLIDHFMPKFLPYIIGFTSDFVMPELTLELILLELVLPKLLETTYMRICFKNVVKFWCICIAWLLDLRSYLLGDVPINPEDEKVEYNPRGLDQPYFREAAPQPEEPPDNAGGLGAAHHALLHRGGPLGFKPYKRPKLFAIRIAILFICMCVTICFGSLATLTVPVFIGRKIMYVLVGNVKIHEMYTGAFGFYLTWLIIRGLSIVLSWVPNGWAAVLSSLKRWAIIGFKAFCVGIILIGVVPLLLGVLIDQVISIPTKVPIYQTPIIFIWQDWVQGLLFTKIVRASIMIFFPTFWVGRAIERVFNTGIQEISFTYIWNALALPLIMFLGLSLSVPYVISQSIVPLFVTSPSLKWFIYRRIYPMLVVMILSTSFVVFQLIQFETLYEHIKNERYLVGRRLVNYDPQVTNSPVNQSSNQEN